MALSWIPNSHLLCPNQIGWDLSPIARMFHRWTLERQPYINNWHPRQRVITAHSTEVYDNEPSNSHLSAVFFFSLLSVRIERRNV